MTTTMPAVAIDGLTKKFGSFTALENVSLAVNPGEVVGLLGENGAGKSTLIKVLSGVYRPDGGRIEVRGSEISLKEPKDAQAAGIVTVHQHSMLAQNLTVAQNLLLGREPGSVVPWIVTRRDVMSAAQRILDDLGVDLPLNTMVEDLSLADRQRVEIARAAHHAGSLIILDEPTAALEPREVDELIRLIGEVKAKGVGVIYVTHRLDEVPRTCDRVVVLRDGKYVGALDHDHAVPDEIIPLLVGRDLGQLFPERAPHTEDVVLEVEDLRVADASPVSFQVRAGEVVALTGAAGAGQRDVARAVCGATPARGTVTIDGTPVRKGRPDHAQAAGIAYVSGDRAADGLFPEQSVWRNIAVGSLRRLSRVGGILDLKGEKALGLAGVLQYGVRAASPHQEIGTLSGGNQQKALIARWALTSPRLLVLDEPTLGIDVGSRREIYDHLAELASSGMAILMVSADNAEIRGMADRVLVFDKGTVVAHMPAHEATEEAVLRARATASTGTTSPSQKATQA